MRILVEEAVRKKDHRPAMNTGSSGDINIIPSVLWDEDDVEGIPGTLSHEGIHLIMGEMLSWEVSGMYDNLPGCVKPDHVWLHHYGLCGWGLKGWEWKADFLMD